MPSADSRSAYTAGIIIVGNEILSGRVQDVNVAWLAGRLNEKGIRLMEVRIVGDTESDIIETLNAVRPRYDYVFTTGGIGPTHDDITAAAVAKAFGTELHIDPTARELLEKYYGAENVNEARLKMAQVPKGATLIDNPVSVAPGFKMENVHVMAGIPRIMQSMFDGLAPNLAGGQPMLSSTVNCGLTESMIAQKLGEVQTKYPDVEIGSYPHMRAGKEALSLVVRSTDIETLKKATDDVVAMITALGGTPMVMTTAA